MSKKRYINDNFWADNWVSDLSREEKYFFLYLITNERSNIAGVYEVPIKNIAFETDFSRDEVIHMFKKMESKITYRDGWVILRNGIKHQNYHNSKINTGIKAILKVIPQELIQYMDLPEDFEYTAPKIDPQQSLLHDPSMTHTSPMDEYNVIKLNTIKSNSIESNADKPQEISKEMTKAQKRSYAIAMEKEREQERRKSDASKRGKSKPESPSGPIERKWR